MSTGPGPSRTPVAGRPQGDDGAPPAASDADERADLEEDRRRQRLLDDGEMGGEA
jgi:hypothetical protein